jgi:hypothetical protein
VKGETAQPGDLRPPSFFAKLFQRSVVPMPSFSKECLGGFMRFQGLAINPNLFLRPSNLFRHRGPQLRPAAGNCRRQWLLIHQFVA